MKVVNCSNLHSNEAIIISTSIKQSILKYYLGDFNLSSFLVSSDCLFLIMWCFIGKIGVTSYQMQSIAMASTLSMLMINYLFLFIS